MLAALLVAWQTLGLLHAIGHLSDGGPDSPSLPQHGAVCALCLAHAGGDGALPAKAPSLPSRIATATIASSRGAPFFCAQPTLPYQVRAPPLALV